MGRHRKDYMWPWVGGPYVVPSTTQRGRSGVYVYGQKKKRILGKEEVGGRLKKKSVVVWWRGGLTNASMVCIWLGTECVRGREEEKRILFGW